MRIKNLITNKDIFPDSADYTISVFSDVRFVINPQETKTIVLPYKLYTDDNEIVFFHFSYKLAEKGLICVNTNIYETRQENLELILNNLKIEGNISQIESIVGSSRRIDIKPNTLLGRLFSIKTN